MHLAVYLPLVMPLLAAVAARPLAGRLQPAAAAWLLVLSAIALALASSAVLGMLALTALVRIPLVDSLAGMSGQVLSQHDPASAPVAIAAGALLAAADAYTLPGLPCRIVITAGMLRALTGPERQVLLAHERAHAAGVHYLFTTAARLAAAANPLLRPVAAAVGYTVERWADERVAVAGASALEAARDLHGLLDYARAAVSS